MDEVMFVRLVVSIRQCGDVDVVPSYPWLKREYFCEHIPNSEKYTNPNLNL